MLYVIAYDIPDDARRTRIADTLKDYGRRVQYSVFEALLDPHLMRDMRNRLLARLDVEEDSVRIYTVCGDCAGRIDMLGLGERTVEPDVIVV